MTVTERVQRILEEIRGACPQSRRASGAGFSAIAVAGGASMSHRWDCPTEWEARREAQHDAEYTGWNHHRYQDDCPEAHQAYEREYRQEQYRIEERVEEARMEALQAERRREMHAQEQMAEWAYYKGQEQRYYEQLAKREYVEDMIAQEIDDGRVNRDAEQP